MAFMNEANFVISTVGETTGDKWYGNFKVKIRLSHRDHMLQDKIRRELLGDAPGAASPRASTSAEIFSQLAVRITDSPTWWANADNGMGLADDNVVGEVYKAAIKSEQDAIENIKKKGEEAKKDLREEEKK